MAGDEFVSKLTTIALALPFDICAENALKHEICTSLRELKLVSKLTKSIAKQKEPTPNTEHAWQESSTQD